MTAPITASFEVEKGLDGPTIIPIDSPSVVAGNSDAVDLKLSNQFVSRRHFQVRFETDVFYLSDLGSTNGTYLNGVKLVLNEEHVLRNGDRVGLGVDKVLLIFSEPLKTVRIDSTVVDDATQSQVNSELVVNSTSRHVWVRGEQLPSMPKKEFDILECLFQGDVRFHVVSVRNA